MVNDLLLPKLRDILRRAEKSQYPESTLFLDPAMQISAKIEAERVRSLKWRFEGGHPDAERQIMQVWPDWMDEDIDIPIVLIRVEWNEKFSAPSHRDILGALMGLGIKREVIGDIFAGSGYGVIIVHEDISAYIAANLQKVGFATVKTEICRLGEFDFPEPEMDEFIKNVASVRLDSMTAAAFNLSRSSAAAAISRDMIKLNHIPINKVNTKCSMGDLISMRHEGRVRFIEILGTTAKGRIKIKLGKFV